MKDLAYLQPKHFPVLYHYVHFSCDAEQDTLFAGQHVVVSTSTASGKSLCYNIPVIEALAAQRNATAIYVFPTKALAQVRCSAGCKPDRCEIGT
jgi:replicative superfamily II helicase